MVSSRPCGCTCVNSLGSLGTCHLYLTCTTLSAVVLELIWKCLQPVSLWGSGSRFLYAEDEMSSNLRSEGSGSSQSPLLGRRVQSCHGGHTLQPPSVHTFNGVISQNNPQQSVRDTQDEANPQTWQIPTAEDVCQGGWNFSVRICNLSLKGKFSRFQFNN